MGLKDEVKNLDAGVYQYTTLNSLISEFIASQGKDSYVATVEDYEVLYWMRSGLQNFSFDILKEIKSIELDMFPSGKVVLPKDFVGLVRFSYVDDKGQAHVMIEDERSGIAKSYLQDHEYNILLDHTYEPLEGSPPKSMDLNLVPVCAGCKPVDLLSSGDYILDKDAGTIMFTRIPKSETFLMEYFSDGLEEADEKVHKFAEEALYDYTYWKLIQRNRNVPANEKERARREFFNSKRLAEARLNPIKWNEIIQILKRV